MGEVDPLIGQVLQDTYRIERRVGDGGMGAVYEASHGRLPRRFAVKMLHPRVLDHPEALARFQREAEITSALGHPHILEVVDFNHTPEGTPYIIMELLEGEDLFTRLRRRGRMDLGQVASIFHQAASALQAAHEKGIVHRDLKPQNIFLCRSGARDDVVKVVDFGMSKMLGAQSLLTGSQTLIGTPAYMSPEQADQRPGAVDLRSDVYTMGVIVFEMLTGQPPFLADSIPRLLFKIAYHDPPLLRTVCQDLPVSVETVVARALSRAPEDRYGSMQAFLEAFYSAIPGLELTELAGQGEHEAGLPGPALVSPAPLESRISDAGLPVPMLRTTLPPAPAASGSRDAMRPGMRTTLSASLGEVRPAPPRSRRRAALVAGGVLIAGVVGALSFAIRRGEPRGVLGPGELRPAVRAASTLPAPPSPSGAGLTSVPSPAPKDAGAVVAPAANATQSHVVAARVPGASKRIRTVKKERKRATSSASVARQKQRKPKDRPREKRQFGDGIVGFD